jgi:uncharacterized protein YcfL
MAVLSVSGLLLVACASTAEQGSYTSQSQKAYAQTRIEADQAYISRVEGQALRRGVGVTWVNPPTKIVAKGD